MIGAWTPPGELIPVEPARPPCDGDDDEELITPAEGEVAARPGAGAVD
jgi:hypothetical protein